MPHERVDLGDAESEGTITVENPDFAFWPEEFGGESESGSDSEGSKRSWIEPSQSAAGMEGVGFDQLVLSPARFLNTPPTEAVVQP